jgi:hypothetical protein
MINQLILEALEVVGVVLGYAIRNGDAMGISLPKPVWDILLGKEGDTTWRDFCGVDVSMIRSCEAILSCDNVEDMVILLFYA